MAKNDKVSVSGAGGDLNGAVFENAATEHTLRELVKILNDKKKGTGNKAEQLYKKALDENIEAVEDTTDMHEEYQKTLKEVNEKSEKFRDTLTDIAKSTVSGIFSGIVATGSLLLDFFKTGFKAFEETNKVGASFNYDLLELRRTAVAAAMPLEEFTKFVSENSKSLAAFGGTVTEGAKKFATLREQFADPTVNKELYNLGFNTESLNKIMAEQLKTEMISGRSRELNSATFTQELKDYTKDLNKLSKVTGISTIQLQEGVTQQMADGRMMTLQNKLTGKSLANFREGLALMNAEIDPKVFDTLKNMMSGVIDPADKFGRMLAVAAPGIMEFQSALGEGKLDVEQQLRGYEKQVGQIERFLGRFSKQQIARIPELKAMQEYLASIKKFTGSNGRAELEGRAAMDGIIGLFSSFGEILNRVKNLFLKAFINTHTMERVQEAFKKLTAFIENKGPAIVKRLEPVMEDIGHWIDKVVDGLIGFGEAFMRGDLKPENIWNWIKQSFAGAIKVIVDGLNAVVSGLMGTTPEQQKQRDAYNAATPEEKEKMRKENPALAMPDVGGIFDKMASGLKSLLDMVPTLKDLALFFGVVGGGSFVAGLGLAAGISAVAAAMAGLTIPALAVGAAFAGLGYALNGFANIINAVSDSFKKISDFFVTMGDTDPAKMKNAGDSIKSLAGAMTELSASGIVGLITGGTLSSLADTIIKFSSVDFTKLSNAGPALTTLHEGLTKFTGGVVESITSFFSTDGGLETVIKSLTRLNDIDITKLQGVSDIGKFFDSLKPLLDVEKISKLPDSLKIIQSSLMDFVSNITSNTSFTANSGINALIESMKQVGNLTSNIASINLTPIIDSFKQMGTLTLSIASTNLNPIIDAFKQIDIFVSSITNTNLNASISSLLESFNKLNTVTMDNTLTPDKVNPFIESIQKFNTIDGRNIENITSGLGSVKTSFGDDLINQAKNVNSFTESINSLVESLKKLEIQLKSNANAPKIPIGSTNTETPVTQQMVNIPNTENNIDNPQKQLNMKIDELILHIKEMKQNTKDTADSLSGRRSAL